MVDKISRIKNAARKYEADQLNLLKKFSAINCNTGNIAGNRQVVDLITQVLKDMDAVIEEIDAPGYGVHLIARISPGSASKAPADNRAIAAPTAGRIIISAHTDTAFSDGDVEKYPYHEENGLAYGLGIGDCKGGLVISLYALKILKEAGLLPNKEFTIIYNCDEEIGSLSARELYKKEVPGAECAYVFERGRGDGGPITSRWGVMEAKIEVFGKSDHAARYSNASSAVEEMAYKIIDLKNAGDKERNVYYSIGPLHSDTHINKVPDYCYCEFCTMLPTMEDKDRAELFLKGLEEKTYIPGCRTKITTRFLYPPMEWTPENQKVAQTYINAAKEFDIKLTEQANNSVGDASYFTYFGVPTCDGLGPMSENSHRYDEYIVIDSVRQRTEIFALTLANLK